MGFGFYSLWLEVENNGHASGERPLKTRQGHRRPFLSTQGLVFSLPLGSKHAGQTGSQDE